MSLSIVIASSVNGCIGKDNILPWRLPKDLKRFKEITTAKNSVIIMGRKTYESIGRPLPSRLNIVLTSDKNYNPHESILVFDSLEKSLEHIKEIENSSKEEHPTFIIGGSGLFKESIDKGLVDIIYHTLVDANVDGDTFITIPDWNISNNEEVPADDKHEHKMFFRTLTRI